MWDRGLPGITLVSAWIDSLSPMDRPPTPAVWLSLDETDSNIEVFLLYFVATIRTVFPAACAETLTLLQAPCNPNQTSLLMALSDELEPLPARLALMLDGYHAIHGEAVYDFLSELSRYWPQRLVIEEEFAPYGQLAWSVGLP